MRFRPHFAVDSIFAPFSAAVASSVAMTLSTSASGVSGRQMKIKSYCRSSMCPSIPLLRLPPKLFRIFFGRFDALVKARHGLAYTVGQNHFDCFGRFHRHLRGDFAFRLAHHAENVVGHVAQRMLRLHSEPDASEFVGSEGTDDRIQAVMAAGAAALANPKHAPWQHGFIAEHDQIFGPAFVTLEQHPNRATAQIHERLRLGEYHIFAGQLADAHLRFRFGPRDSNSGPLSDGVDREKADVVRRPVVLRALIAEANDHFHSKLQPMAYFFFSDFSALAGASAASPSPSSSFLPFFITSGSAGAASAVTAASAAGSSSFFKITTCAITRTGSVTSLIFAGSKGRSAARSCLPIIMSVTSTRNSSGMSPGKHSTSTSRVTVSNTPPCSFTPCASPNVCTGTMTRMRTSIAMRNRSTCSSLPLTGSTCQSRTIAFSSAPLATDTVKIVL